MANEYVHIMLSLVGILLFIFFIYYLATKLNTFKTVKQDGIRILNISHISTKQKLVLVEINHTKLLLGATDNQLNKLHEFTAAHQGAKNSGEDAS